MIINGISAKVHWLDNGEWLWEWPRPDGRIVRFYPLERGTDPSKLVVDDNICGFVDPPDEQIDHRTRFDLVRHAIFYGDRPPALA